MTIMRRGWRWAAGTAVAIPVVAYVLGTLAAAETDPVRRPPIVVDVDPTGRTTAPSPSSPDPSSPDPSSPSPSSPSPSPSDEGTSQRENDRPGPAEAPETVLPSPEELDDDGDDGDDGDDRDDDGPGEREEDD